MMRKVAEESTSKLRHSNHGVVLYKDVMVPCAELDRDLSISLFFSSFLLPAVYYDYESPDQAIRVSFSSSPPKTPSPSPYIQY